MNYRHGYHAGNFADVVKHLAEVAILMHLARKDTPFVVIDSHAGSGLYDLASQEALKTGEAASGIQALEGLSGGPLLDRYLGLVRELGGKTYPGSPLVAAKMLRPQDRLVAIERQPAEAQALKKALSAWRKAKVEEADGYARLAALLPPPERRGLVLIDPPFEAPDEFEMLGEAARTALRRFATGIYLIWYPIKSTSARALEGEILAAARKLLKIEVAIDAPEGKLSRAGLLVINPPFALDTAMAEGLAQVAPRLKAQTRLQWLAGKD